VLDIELINPVGQVYVYSDLSMITMMYAVGNIIRAYGLVDTKTLLPECIKGFPSLSTPGIGQCYYEAYVRTVLVPTMQLNEFSFLPDKSVWGRCMPTWNDTDGSAPGPGYRFRSERRKRRRRKKKLYSFPKSLSKVTSFIAVASFKRGT